MTNTAFASISKQPKASALGKTISYSVALAKASNNKMEQPKWKHDTAKRNVQTSDTIG